MAYGETSAFTFDIDSSSDRLVHLVRLGGEIDMSNGPALKAVLAALRGDVVVDLHAVTFLDSIGLATLIGAYQTSAARGESLQLVNLSPSSYRVFESSGLVDLFGIEAPGA